MVLEVFGVWCSRRCGRGVVESGLICVGEIPGGECIVEFVGNITH